MLKTLALAASFCALLLSPAAAQAAPVIGQPAPAFTGTDSNGKTHNLADYKGKIVVLEWHNDQCPYVKKFYESGAMQSLQRQAAADGIVWLTVNSAQAGKQGYFDAAGTNELIAKQGSVEAGRIIDTDGTIGQAYGAKTTPHMYVIDAEGVLAYMGAIDDRPTADKASLEGATNYVMLALTALANGEKPEHEVTQPYGCSVKYEGVE